ncbi:MAG: hypothetical protein AAFP89_06950 [Bacteroidota bacterium]
MSTLDRIKEISKEILAKFLVLDISYKYYFSSDIHFIRVPYGLLDNEEFLVWSLDVIDQFEDTIGASLAFVDEKSLTRFDQPDWSLVSPLEGAQVVTQHAIALDVTILEDVKIDGITITSSQHDWNNYQKSAFESSHSPNDSIEYHVESQPITNKNYDASNQYALAA